MNALGEQLGQCSTHRLDDLAALNGDELAGLVVTPGVVLRNRSELEALGQMKLNRLVRYNAPVPYSELTPKKRRRS